LQASKQAPSAAAAVASSHYCRTATGPGRQPEPVPERHICAQPLLHLCRCSWSICPLACHRLHPSVLVARHDPASDTVRLAAAAAVRCWLPQQHLSSCPSRQVPQSNSTASTPQARQVPQLHSTACRTHEIGNTSCRNNM
jgi:hypothetical protein